jgi:hypothetical protein
MGPEARVAALAVAAWVAALAVAAWVAALAVVLALAEAPWAVAALPAAHFLQLEHLSSNQSMSYDHGLYHFFYG